MVTYISYSCSFSTWGSCSKPFLCATTLSPKSCPRREVPLYHLGAGREWDPQVRQRQHPSFVPSSSSHLRGQLVRGKLWVGSALGCSLGERTGSAKGKRGGDGEGVGGGGAVRACHAQGATGAQAAGAAAWQSQSRALVSEQWRATVGVVAGRPYPVWGRR